MEVAGRKVPSPVILEHSDNINETLYYVLQGSAVF